jgi:hypothetical protein
MITMKVPSSAAFFFLLLPASSLAWTSSIVVPRTDALLRRPSTSLHVGATWSLDNVKEEYDNVASSDHMMHRAQACADSESCSVEEAQICLDKVLHIQQNCIGSGVLSTSADVCGLEAYDILPNIVDKLRHRIQAEQRRLVFVTTGLHALNLALGTFIVVIILHGLVADPNVPVDSFGSASAGVVPFLPMEWVWAVRDGYVPLLLQEWIRNGGLVVDPAVFEVKAVPITGQEWMWATQSDSLGRLMQEHIQYGGLRVDPGYHAETKPLQLQEWWWAIRDGYAGQALQHVLRNGGL